MPLYEYECLKCGKVLEMFNTIADRDNIRPGCIHEESPRTATAYFMWRKQSAPAFTVQGFNAKNGYAKD